MNVCPYLVLYCNKKVLLNIELGRGFRREKYWGTYTILTNASVI